MARWHRSSDGPVPYGPSPEPPAAPTHREPEAETAGMEPGGKDDADGVAANTPPSPPAPTPSAYPPFASPGAPLGGAQPVTPWAPPPGAYSTTASGVQGIQYARTLDRVMAYLLDGFIVSVPVLVIAFVLGTGSALGWMQQGGMTLVAGIIGMGIHLLYFVSFWTGGAQATPGMRLMKLRIGDANTGATPTVQQGLIRWLALGGIFQVMELVPALLVLGALVSFVWELILLATTASSPTKQGLHDRMASTVLVQPVGAQTPAVTCLVIVVALFGLWVLGLVLVLLSGDVSRILSEVGASI